MKGHLLMSSRHNAITSASLCVALGAGAFLCARAYSKSISSSNGSGLRTRESLAVAASKNGVPESESTRETRPAGDVNSEKEPATTTAADAPAKPCGGCDCGLMEPGPIEGTMHAYERHIIICR